MRQNSSPLSLVVSGLLFLILMTNQSHANDIIVTQVASQTHPVSSATAKGIATGFNTFFARVNDNGGVDGRKVILKNVDDHFEPAQTVKLTREAIADSSSVALFGLVGIPNLSDVVKWKVLAEGDIALVAPVSGIPALMTAPNVFSVRASFYDELRQIARHSKNIQLAKPAFIFLETPFSKNLVDVLQSELTKTDRKLAGSAGVAAALDPEAMKGKVIAAINTVLATNPDMIIIFGPGSMSAEAITQLRAKRDTNTPVYLLSSSNWEDLVAKVGIKNASGVMISQALPLPTDSRVRIVRDYLNDLKKYSPAEKPSHYGLEGYIGARILHEAMRKAGPQLTRQKVTAALNKLGTVELGDFEVNYTADQKMGTTVVDVTLINKNGMLIH